jgi:hypothetical protein
VTVCGVSMHVCACYVGLGVCSVCVGMSVCVHRVKARELAQKRVKAVSHLISHLAVLFCSHGFGVEAVRDPDGSRLELPY